MQDKSRKNKDLGDEGEDLAEGHLRSLGFEIRARNVRYKCGEIDIVAERGGELHFVEVKARTSGTFGTSLESITDRKKGRMRKAAQLYLKSPRNRFKGKPLPPCFFSIIAIDYQGEKPGLECILDAFD